jgi:hypothetical protein
MCNSWCALQGRENVHLTPSLLPANRKVVTAPSAGTSSMDHKWKQHWGTKINSNLSRIWPPTDRKLREQSLKCDIVWVELRRQQVAERQMQCFISSKLTSLNILTSLKWVCILQLPWAIVFILTFWGKMYVKNTDILQKIRYWGLVIWWLAIPYKTFLSLFCFAALGFEHRAYTFSYSTSPFLWWVFSR